MKKIFCPLGISAAACLLLACQQSLKTAVAEETAIPLPKETASLTAKSKILDKSIQQTCITEYRCKGEKIVKVVETIKSSKKTPAKNSIKLTFNNNTQQLLAAVSEVGKRYTNINWHWQVKKDYAMLTTATGTILAEQCEVANSSKTN
ncbi:membrane-bound lysozyme inhibitor of c-type lysozyme MliC [Cricetibacter osteomyelitidis]|uniref:Membrane-bound lysozyme inhibitor of c-type lysozyme MliC n=1 Tax=Cricetibacter osteomyelitidis TaxID=1521931 RepID=A0A4V2T1V0_9PAST|nr:MliC family protein [Cricetibacter osteomyelitidis]TCP94953.1 membrane-bound lysozyme inhibitor of c-type lysozyme MliC [Cricetibacter osteomyelitidis]